MTQQVDDANELCPICSRIELPSSREDWLCEHATVPEVISFASKGCQFCKMLSMVLELDSVPSSQENIVVLETFSTELISLRCSLRSKTQPSLRSSCFELTRWNEPMAEFPPLPSHAASSEIFNIARRSLSECIQNHTCASNDKPPLPTRVLDLVGPNPGFIRLCVPPTGTKARYAALSYCWGKAKTFTTTSSTLPRILNGFPLSDLPRTLRDAVQVTRELGLQYLWIDALCILQGEDEASRNDWKKEAAKMESVYGSAHFTIVAAAARHSDEGIFYPRTCKLIGRDSISKSKGAVVVMLPNKINEFREDSINSRAWTLQESLLSPRLLIYRLGEMIWQCDVGMVHERSVKSVYDIDPIYKYRLPKDKPL